MFTSAIFSATSKSSFPFPPSKHQNFNGQDVYKFDVILFKSPRLCRYYKMQYFHKRSALILDHMDTYAAACKSPEVGMALAGIQGLFTPWRGFCSAKIPGTFSKHKGSAGLSTA